MFLFSHSFSDLLFYRAVTFTLDGGIKIINIELFLWGKVLHCVANKCWYILICTIFWDVELWGRQAVEGWPLAVPTGYPGV